jgi:hypothetical protein
MEKIGWGNDKTSLGLTGIESDVDHGVERVGGRRGEILNE